MNAKLVLCLSIVAILSPAVLAIIAGFNADIHMDIPGALANDFHIEGKIKSGAAGANWNSPPTLVGHIDGSFQVFNYSITPDTTNPDQNMYNFKADWSGFTYKYCEILHLGLFFDLECNNLVIDLVGWWTFNGQRLVGRNGGAIPISGFMVQDLPDQGPQRMRILNDSQLGGGGSGGAGIPLEIVQMGLVSMPRAMALEMFGGSLNNIFPELRLDGMQERLPWIPVANARGPLSSTNPQPFAADSFFDIFLEVNLPGQGQLFPVQPIHIETEGILLSRMLVGFTNNANQREFRWVWHMHEAHGLGDLGDAPDSTNHAGAAMTAYPPGGPMGVQANFPTVFLGPAPFGPIHRNPQAIFLGAGVSTEFDADLPPDMDGPTNITPPLDQPNQDGFDDGLLLLGIKPCQPSQFNYIVTVTNPVVNQMFVNVWFDWNRDGDWDDTLQCSAATAPAPEWAVQNQPVPIPGIGSFPMTTPQFMTWFSATTPMTDLWMRITISEQPWIPPMPPVLLGYGGSGPQGGYKFGETEDYYLKFEFPPDQDFGDAPDGFVPGYPTLLANNGARHTISPNLMMGVAIDAEADGQPNATATGDDLNGVPNDEDGVAFGPLVAGLPAMAMVQTTGPGVLQAWIDFNSNNSWADAGEQIAADLPIPGPGLHPVNFAIPATAAGKKYARFRFSSVRKLPFFGPAPDGEVEDYQIEILKPAVEIDQFDDVAAEIELTNPDGTLQSIPANGSAKTNVYFEGSNEGDASDSDGDGLDDVKTEMVALNLAGTAPLGPFTIKLRAAPASTGEMEETANNTVGRLDVPPFTAVGMIDSFFDIYVEVTLGTNTFTTAKPLRVRGNLTHKPANPCDALIGQNTEPLIDAQGQPVGYRIKLSELVLVRCKLDWGDAPDGDFVPGYPTLAINNGARHEIDPKIFLGNLIDAERDGQPDGTATGDDLNKLDDEDGVKFLTWPLVPGKWAKIEVKASVNGLLYGWIDYGADNSWAETGDQVFFSKPLVAGVQTLPFYVPITAKANSTTFARFRFTRSTVSISYDGYAPNGEVEDYLVKIGENCGIKWVQLPDTTPMGIDIAVDQQWTLADDFLCTSVDKITDVHLWGSWLQDKKGAIKKIHLSIHSDDPVGPGGTDPQNGYSKPDKLLWQMDFYAGDFTEKLYAKLPKGEYWWDPLMDVGPIPGGDTEIWQVDIKIDPEKAFLQDGSREKPIVYWLDVHVEASDGRFGWKTRRWPDHFNDDAVAMLANMPAPLWRELRYPPGHPYHQMELNSIDMAFAITAREFCCGSADLNCDGLVDILDFAIFASQWLQVAP
jgi:hypothetical protein